MRASFEFARFGCAAPMMMAQRANVNVYHPLEPDSYIELQRKLILLMESVLLLVDRDGSVERQEQMTVGLRRQGGYGVDEVPAVIGTDHAVIASMIFDEALCALAQK